MMKIKKKDLEILKNLREDGRRTLTSISKKTKLPITTIYERIKKQEGELIKRHTCLIDFNRLGYKITAKILVEADFSKREDMRKYLENHSNINSLCKITNGFDFMIEAIFKEINEVEEFIEELELKFDIRNKRYFLVTEELKREVFLSQII